MSDAYARAQKAQRDAADPLASVFVTANAGSGKTKVLIDRVARLLLRADNEPSSFLCITYTKAAAAEMQRRLFKRLGDWCVAPDKKLREELSALLGRDVRVGPSDLARARALFARALETPGGLKIQTIHAFCERLLGRFPLEAGVAPGFEIADDPRAAALLAEAWADVAADPDSAKALARLAALMNADRLETLISAMNAQRGALRRHFKTVGGLGAARAQLRKRHNAKQDRVGFLRDFLTRVPWDTLTEACGQLRNSSANDQKCAERVATARAASPERQFERYLDIFFTGAGEPRKDILTKKLAAANPALARLFENEAQRAVNANETLKAIARADDCDAVLTLGDGLLAAYDKAKKYSGVLDFEDLIERASALLSRSEAAPWILYKLDGGIDHILIDEGQDTSPAQWSLLSPLRDEFFAGGGAREKTRTVFAVGDPKQSIYSFQGADPEGFLDQSQQLSVRAHAASLLFRAPEMEMSFRSTPIVLQAVDATFEGLSLTSGAGEGETIHHDAKREQDQGLVEWWPITPAPERVEPQPWDAPLDAQTGKTTAAGVLCAEIAKRVAYWIEHGEAVWDKDIDEQRPMRPGDVIALVRKRGAVFSQLLKAFKAQGLPVAGADRMTLKDELAVEDLLALARVALDEGDDLSLAAALKSPFIGLDDNDLLALAPNRKKDERLISRLRASLPHAEAYKLIEDAIKARDLHPYRFFARILEEKDTQGRSGWTRLFARLGEAARDPVEELLARALSAGDHGPPTLHHLVAAIDVDEAQIKRELEAGGDSIRVMTIHGAKGLEAPVVILADTTGDYDPRSESGLMTDKTGIYWSPSKKQDDKVTKVARDAAREAAQREHHRLLYVAMTRARDRLIVCGPAWKNDRHVESWHALIENGLRRLTTEDIETPFGPGLRLGASHRTEKTTRTEMHTPQLPRWAFTNVPAELAQPRALSPSRVKASEPPAFTARAQDRRRFRRGNLIHGLLQRLPDVSLDRREAAAHAWLKAQGADAAETKAFAREALNVLTHPDFAAVFGPGSRAEAPIVGRIGERRIGGQVDRLLVTPDHVLVLDFKTDRPAPEDPALIPDAYAFQLAAYRAVLAKAFPDRPIRCALLWTEAPRLMEIPLTKLEAVLTL